MPGGAPEDGYVVQKVELDYRASLDDADDECVEPISEHVLFYELIGPIAKGKKVPYGYGCNDQIYFVNDEIEAPKDEEGKVVYWFDHNRRRYSMVSDGYQKWKFNAKFYSFEEMEGYLPSDSVINDDGEMRRFWGIQPNYAGYACASEVLDLNTQSGDPAPPFWDENGSVERVMEFKWDCCNNGEQVDGPTTVTKDTNCR